MPSPIGPRVRSVSMNTFLARQDNAGVYESYAYKKYSELGRPSMIWVFVDEHPDSINDGCFSALKLKTSTVFDDLPASAHNGACGFSFADGHAETHKWRDAATLQPVTKKTWNGGSIPSPTDAQWMAERSWNH